MRPTSQEVLNLLIQLSENPDNGIIRHCKCVGDAAAVVASALVAKGYALDVDKVRALGYLHDIGRLLGPSDEHIVNGYNYLKQQGFTGEYCNICLTHSFPENHPILVLSFPPDPVKEKLVIDFLAGYEYSLTDKIINLCDLMCVHKVMTIDKRIVNVISRHGTWAGTQECVLAIQRLKQFFDELLGYNLYDLFPKIKENL